MSKIMSKTQKDLLAKTIKLVEESFKKYFYEYYQLHSEVKRVSYYTMKDDMGFSAIIDYEGFRQYINFYYSNLIVSDNAFINSCFEFEYNKKKFLCHFVDILDSIDSDDLSFYLYPNCTSEDRIRGALNKLMSATQTYFSDIDRIAKSDDLKKPIYENYCDEDEISNEIENTWDYTYDFFERYDSLDELKKYLNKQNKRGNLEDGYEKRAYRVLNQMTPDELKSMSKQSKKTKITPIKYKILVSIPYIVFSIVFFILFAILGLFIDKKLYENYVGQNTLQSVFIMGVCGVLFAFIFVGILGLKIYKPIVKKDDFNNFSMMLAANSSSIVLEIILYLGLVAVAAYLLSVFAFNGFAFNENEIVYKEYLFSQQQISSFSKTDIAIVKGSYDDDGYYTDYGYDSYAFNINGKWYEYGVPSDEKAQKIIQDNIVKYNKQLKAVESIEDLEE